MSMMEKLIQHVCSIPAGIPCASALFVHVDEQ
jgi:hypothetical protein